MWCIESLHATLRFADADPWRYMTLLVAPLSVFLVAGKLFKYTAAVSRGSTETTVALGGAGAALLEYLPMPMLLLSIAVMLGIMLQIRFAQFGAVFVPAVVATCAVGGSALTAVFEEPPAWASLAFMEVIRFDLLFCVLFAAAGVFAIKASRLLLPFTVALVHVVAIAAGMLAVLDASYFLKTGSLADSYLLWYTLTNTADLRYIVTNELVGIRLLFIAAPVLLSFAPALVANKRTQSRVDLHRATPVWRMKRGCVMVALAAGALGLTPSISVAPAASALTKSTPQMLMRSVSLEGIQPEVEVKSINLSDTYRWMATDSTKFWNILVVVLESVRSDPRGPYDASGEPVMPFLDSLGVVGMSAADASAVVPHTNKALVSILCGVPPRLSQGRSEIGVSSCLPELLADHGYDSAFFTPADLEFERKDTLLAQMHFAQVFGDGSMPAAGFSRVNYFGAEDRIMLEPALEWIRERREQGTPYLAAMLTLTSHHDYGVPSDFEVSDYAADATFNLYLNTLRYQDDFLRDLIGTMERSGQLDDTMVIIAGDHGEAFGEHGLRFHSGVVYEEGLSVPLIVLAPSGADSVVVDGPRSQTDILPTIADFLGFEESAGTLPGVSLQTPASDRELYSAGWLENQAMSYRSGGLKYVYHFRRRPMEVFDLAVDPGERSDLAPTMAPQHIQMVERQLLAWRSSVNAFHDRYVPARR